METHFDFNSTENGSPRKVLQDVRVLMQDVESLVKEASLRLSAKSRDELDVALVKMNEARKRLENQAKKTVEHTAVVVRKHPYESLGIACGVGIVLGLILGRK
jgi:ElaB/YqjD/DUF883 family membrane-anchored ribosome-binding protein